MKKNWWKTMNKTVLITGASSGIGEALAYAYSNPTSTIGLISRRKEVLDIVAKKCKELGAEVYIYPIDISNQVAVEKAVKDFLKQSDQIDVVIANAGIGGIDNIECGDATETNNILSTNILGISNVVIPCIPSMIENNEGHVVILSSVAGFRGMIKHGAYSSSKTAVRILGDGWRFALSRNNIYVTNICPGFIDTPLVQKNRFNMPFLMSPEAAATKIKSAIENKKKCYVFPWQWRFLLPLIRIIPDRLIQWASLKFNF